MELALGSDADAAEQIARYNISQIPSYYEMINEPEITKGPPIYSEPDPMETEDKDGRKHIRRDRPPRDSRSSNI